MTLLLCVPSLLAWGRGDGIKLSQLSKARTQTWQQWCNQWEREDTLPRMSMQSLEEAYTCCWALPGDLEPKARMNFYSGTKGERPKAGYPVYLYLHGSGPREMEWATGLQLAKKWEDAPSLYIVPQIPNEGEYYRWWQRSKQWAWYRLLRQMLANPDVDAARLYLLGISEGGYGSQRLASYYADYLAAAAPMAGGEPLHNAPAENLSHTPFSLVTGEHDRMFYRRELTLRTAERLDSLAQLYPGMYTHRVMLEEGRGHAITYAVSTPWMQEFRREAQPKHFRWENFEMDGVKRNNFYNLEVLSEQGEERMDYEFDIQDNIIRLNVRQVEYTVTQLDPNWGIWLNHTRNYTPATQGRVRIYLSEELADLSRPVTIYVNGSLHGTQTLRPSRATMQRSASLWGDPLRLFPCAIEVDIQGGK